MLDKIKNFFKKAPKGFVALPIAVAAVALVTVLALPFFGNNASSDSGNKGPVISFNDKDNNNIENDNDIDNDSNGSGDLVGDNGSSENGDSDINDNTDNGSTDNNNGGNNNNQSGSENGDSNEGDSNNSSNGTTSNPSGSTDNAPDDSNNDSNDGNAGNIGNNDDGNSGSNGDSNSDNPGNTGNNSSDSNTENNGGTIDGNGSTSLEVPGIDISEIPAYSGSDYIVLNNNTPYFSVDNLSTNAFEFYSELDSFGRCGVAYACLGPELMPPPDENRGSISHVKPSGWIQKNYSCIRGDGHLYDRSHLIAWSLAGENANIKNLITGTQHMNQDVMTDFEDMIRDYIKETGNHVIYRVTPMFEGDNLVATGVQMEAWSIEDDGDKCFNIFIYNVQAGVIIDYKTGDSSLDPSYDSNNGDNDDSSETGIPEGTQFIVNGKSGNGKIHKATCGNAQNLASPIYCKTFEEAKEASKKIMGNYVLAGCCMKDYTSYDGDDFDGTCQGIHAHPTVNTNNIRLYAAIAVRDILINTKKNVSMA